MTLTVAHAKINLALVVGPVGPGGKHEVTTVLQRVSLADWLVVEQADGLTVEGFADDTIVRLALERLAQAADLQPSWRAKIEKRIPVAAGLGGGSSDAAAALTAANARIGLPRAQLHEIAVSLGADVPFFLARGPQLGEGDGSTLKAIELPMDYVVLVLLPDGETKSSTADVYARFDIRNGPDGYGERRSRLLEALAAGDLAALPPNDLASSPLAGELRSLGAFRADVSGAGPAVFGLFSDLAVARAAAERLRARSRIWIVAPAW